ncbi:adhesion G-protein coupled receptor G5 [Athene noctua]|uniref:adhesion G-protein coupled receptor G5 n=1 Tax=Athene noctua TaxID=126797 RepID=UPI003EBEB9CA
MPTEDPSKDPGDGPSGVPAWRRSRSQQDPASAEPRPLWARCPREQRQHPCDAHGSVDGARAPAQHLRELRHCRNAPGSTGTPAEPPAAVAPLQHPRGARVEHRHGGSARGERARIMGTPGAPTGTAAAPAGARVGRGPPRTAPSRAASGGGTARPMRLPIGRRRCHSAAGGKLNPVASLAAGKVILQAVWPELLEQAGNQCVEKGQGAPWVGALGSCPGPGCLLQEMTTAMPTPSLISLVLCLTTCVLQTQGSGPKMAPSEMEREVVALEKKMEQACGRTHHPGQLLKSLEEQLARWEKYNFTGSMIEVYVFKFMSDRFRGLKLSSRMDMKRDGSSRFRHAMNFPAELVKGIQSQGVEQELVCIYIHSPCIFQDAHNSSVLNNYVLGAYLRSGHVAGLSQPVEIQIWHDMVLDASNATCVFWQPEAGTGSTGSWSKEGCETTHREGTVICHCNHLTYFAVLLLPADALSQAQLASLTHLSTIGCSVSAVATLCTLLLCCFSRQRLRDNTTKIHMHLLAALLLLNCSFLLSTPLADSAEGLCRVTAALLHAGLLCTLAWMAAEAFHLLLLLVKVYNVYIQHYLLKLCLFAWGLPTLAVVAVFVFRRDTYGYHTIKTSEGYSNVTMCWLTSPPAHYATLCYAGLILLFNMLVLGRVVTILRRIQQQKGQARKDWVTVLGLTCLLGTTWSLAFFSFGVFLVPQLYLFTILNSLQGLFVCLWYVTVHRQSKLRADSNTYR